MAIIIAGVSNIKLLPAGDSLAASAAVFCTQPHVILLKYGEI